MSYRRAETPFMLLCMSQSQVRTVIPYGRAIERARRAVERASAGYATHLDLETDARPVLAMLLRERALNRAILLIERDEARARIAITPRRASGPPTVTEIFEEDHARLDTIAAALCDQAKARRAHAIVLSEMLIHGLRRHIRIEEEVLFPLFESRSGRSYRADTILMRREHVAIDRYLDDIGRAVDAFRAAPEERAPIDDLLRAYWGLNAVLADHNVKEERRLFPIIDRALAAIDRYELLRSVVLF
jgi:hemerythrin-like domain-containing protein